MNRLTVLFLLAGACSAQDLQVYIIHNQVISENCVIPDGSGNTFVSSGFLDVTDPVPNGRVNSGYLFAAAVQNATTASKTQPNAHTFFVHGADVEMRSNGSPASDALVAAMAARGLSKRTQFFGGTAIGPGATAGIGYDLIDGEQTLALNDLVAGDGVQIITHSRLFGKLDSDDFDTDFFDYPITLCRGCLIIDLGACSAIPSGTTFSTGGTCNLLQDANLDCCTNAAGATVCPPPTAGSG